MLSCTVSELSQLTVQIFGHFAFLSHPLGAGLGTMYDVHLGLSGKSVVDSLLVLMDFFR